MVHAGLKLGSRVLRSLERVLCASGCRIFLDACWIALEESCMQCRRRRQGTFLLCVLCGSLQCTLHHFTGLCWWALPVKGLTHAIIKYSSLIAYGSCRTVSCTVTVQVRY